VYFPATLPHLDYATFTANIQEAGSSNEGRGFTTKRNFTNGYFNYSFHGRTISTTDFFLMSAADAAVLGDEGVFHCSNLRETRTLASSQPIEICSDALARWLSPDGKVYIALRGGGRPDTLVAIADSMTRLDELSF
jgi:hypothetical protein